MKSGLFGAMNVFKAVSGPGKSRIQRRMVRVRVFSFIKWYFINLRQFIKCSFIKI